MKRVLVIPYYWPPSGGSGVQRWVKFVKYLPAEGWEPVVWAPEKADYPSLDPSFEKEVPADVEVLRGLAYGEVSFEPRNLNLIILFHASSVSSSTHTSFRVR